jgi:T4-like virus Myoviridae tail sheath stabiliser
VDFWYSEQFRNYRLQFIRAFSNFYVQTGNGGPNNTPELIRVPCRYGDSTRIAAAIVRGNSENKILSVPFISCWVNNLGMSSDRRQDPQLVDPAYVNERLYDGEKQAYTDQIGNRYAIQRYMPVPYMLTFQVDIWTNNTSIKEQLLEQILVLYNPAIDVQTSVNPIDWTVLTYIEMQDNITWTSRTIPVGTDNPIDVASLQFKVPIWINPPAKVQKQSIIQQIVTNIVDGTYDAAREEWTEYEFLARNITTPGNAVIKVKQIAGYDYALSLCDQSGSNLDKDQNATVTFSKTNPALSAGLSFTWNNVKCTITSSNIDQAISDIKQSLTGTKLNCEKFNSKIIQFINTSAGDNTFSDVTPGALEALGVTTYYPGGTLAWWRLLQLYGSVKTYADYGTNASQIRLKTSDDIEQTNTDIVGWIDYDISNQNILALHLDTASLPATTLPPINAIVNPQVSGPGLNLPEANIGQRYLITELPVDQSAIWGKIDPLPGDIITFDGNMWLPSWTPAFTGTATQYVLNLKTLRMYCWQDGHWFDIIHPEYLPGYWRIAL